MKGTVYFAKQENTGAVKIGLTNHVKGRLARLKPYYGRCELIASLPGVDEYVESAFCCYFDKKRYVQTHQQQNREWFLIGNADIEKAIAVYQAGELASGRRYCSSCGHEWPIRVPNPQKCPKCFSRNIYVE